MSRKYRFGAGNRISELYSCSEKAIRTILFPYCKPKCCCREERQDPRKGRGTSQIENHVFEKYQCSMIGRTALLVRHCEYELDHFYNISIEYKVRYLYITLIYIHIERDRENNYIKWRTDYSGIGSRLRRVA